MVPFVFRWLIPTTSRRLVNEMHFYSFKNEDSIDVSVYSLPFPVVSLHVNILMTEAGF